MKPHSVHPEAAQAPKSVFFAALVVIFFSSLSAADSVGFVPCALDGSCTQSSVPLSQLPMLGVSSTGSAAPQAHSALPARIEIPSAGIDLPVQNPKTTDVDQLDALLQQGPARYADSAQLGEDGNVIIFAHSSHLPIVHNQMFRAFNSIPDLRQGDSITLVGDDGTSYLYAVDSVVKADTESGTSIPLSPSVGKELTLVTCDTLTGKSARFVLTAHFVGTL
jgi:LPXTG-site transpeptidase (sortase) family protein